ncbi:MAG: sulfate adenylyltransferase subunit CysN [Planctomycetia bacterium]|nr:sulfate adenylyltransferase subunit CysN [Planctomycetia bacterium]
MSHQSELIATNIDEYLTQHERKEMLRLLTCGSVDDGKSTLIGKLLLESKMVFEDHLAALQKDSDKHGTTGGELDPALLSDGLEDERQQGITIDVAYRYFSTAKRKFIIADTPGHQQYTRNMATGASNCDLAIILIDARPGHGVLEQTKRHSFIVSLLGIRHVVVAVNKMDLVGYSQEVFERIRADYLEFAAKMSADDVTFIPISALKGDNIVAKSQPMAWYEGSTLMHHLENVYIGSDRNLHDFRFPVQYVNRPHLDFRGFCGTVASGIVRRGDEIMAIPSRKTSRVKSIVTFDGELQESFAGQAVTLTLEDEIDISRGDMIVRPGNVPPIMQRFDCNLVWMSETPMVPGKQYLIKQATKSAAGCVSTLRYRIDVNTLQRSPAPTLGLNEIGRCEIELTEPACIDSYRRNRTTGALILIDRITNATVAAAMALDTSPDRPRDHWDDPPASTIQQSARQSEVTSDERSRRYGQKPATVLFTGLTGSGKRSIALALERRLFEDGRAVTVLDGQNMRLGISRDLGFSAEERSENLRRAAEVSRLMNDAGLITIASFVAPSDAVRQRAREVIGPERFIEVYLDVPVEVCRKRDQSGMYAKADAGEIPNFPGVSAPFDVPPTPDLTLKAHELSIDTCAERIIALLKERGVVKG